MREIGFREALNEALREELARDPSVIVMGEDIGVMGGIYGVTKGLMEEFGEERVRDTPISEEGFVGAAIGAAATGLKPVVEMMYSDFLANCYNQVVNFAAKMRYMSGGQVTLPLVIRAMVAHARGHGGEHSQVPTQWFLNVPGLKIALPSTPFDAKGLLKAAVRDSSPVLFFEPHVLYKTKGGVPEEDYVVPLGKADVKREGKDVTVIAISAMVPRALEAAARLAQEGVEAEVLDPRTLCPLDRETLIRSVKKTGRAVTVEYSPKTGGAGAEICATIVEEAFDYLDAPVVRVAAPDVPIPVSPPLLKLTVPDAERIISAVRSIVS